ncbi:hypothetical protein M8J76_010684 [Diaphorina citri]|nr:hypothetical protein M8J76_010684 [Diaphorina citri]
MNLRRTKSEIVSRGISGPKGQFGCFDDTKSLHSTLDSIYSKNSIIRNDDECKSQYSRDMEPIGFQPKAKSIFSNVKRSKSMANGNLGYASSCTSTSDNRSLCSVHSVRSVFQRAQDNYKTIIGKDYPLSKVLNIWKTLCEYVEQQLVLNKSTVIPKLGMFTIIETNLQGYIHKKPVLIINKSLLKIHGLTSKKYNVGKVIQRHILNFSDISSKCKMNRFIVEEVISEVIKSFEKLLMTKRNSELPFFQIGKLQMQACEIRMKFYEDFINKLNRSLFKSKSSTSLISGISKLSRTSSVISRMTSKSERYKPSPEFCSVLPVDTEESRAVRKNSSGGMVRRIQSSCSLVSQRTKDTQSLLSIPCGSTHSKRSCCSQRPSREAHGDACMCIVCANRFKFDKDINFKKKILAGHQEEEKRKNVLVGGFSKVDQNEHRQRIENEKRTKELQKNAAKYNSQFVQRKSIKRPKESDSSALENNAIMYNRQNSECERRKHNLSNIEEIKQQIKMKKCEERSKKQLDERSMKERNEKLTKLLYEERIKNIKEKDCKRSKLKQDLDKQIQEKKTNKKTDSIPDYNFNVLRKTPLRNNISSLSDIQRGKEQRRIQAEYQKVQMKEKQLREEMQRDEEDELGRKFVENMDRDVEQQREKDIQKKLQLREESQAMYKQSQCKQQDKTHLQPMGFLLEDAHRKEKCLNCSRKLDWTDHVHAYEPKMAMLY